jgi:hypothetical protein
VIFRGEGWELGHKVSGGSRLNELSPSPPVPEPQSRRAFTAGFDAHLVKPADPEEFHELLGQAGAPA